MQDQPRRPRFAPGSTGGQFSTTPRAEASTPLGRVEDSAANRLIAELAASGLAAHGHDSMPTTYHRPRLSARTGFELDDRPDQSSLTGFSPGMDKPAGALWSAPGRVSGGVVWSAWTDWMALEGSNRDFSLVPLEVTPGGVVIRIDDAGDAERLATRYPVQADARGRFDWAGMRADGVDGVWLTTGGVDAVNQDVGRGIGQEQPAISSFYGWDVSSVAWLSTAHLVAGDLVPVGPYRSQSNEIGYPMLAPDGPLGPLDEGARPRV